MTTMRFRRLDVIGDIYCELHIICMKKIYLRMNVKLKNDKYM